ncbi:hypothetical protein [Modestobacter sp. URMC 112]
MPSTTAPDATPVVRPAPPVPARGPVPLPVVAVALLAVAESLALLALGLTGLDGVLAARVRPDGAVVALVLLVLATWVVLCAGGGANLADGAGRLLLVSVSAAEVGLLLAVTGAGLLGVGGVGTVVVGPLGALPLPALTLLGLGVPMTKLLLAFSLPATEWLAAGPRPRARRPALPPRQRVVRGVTLGVIGLALTTVALVGPPAGPATVADPASVGTAP